MSASLTFDAVAEDAPGERFFARWSRSWPAYRAWFVAQGGEAGPDRATGEAALARHMPELVPVHARLVDLAGGDDLAARFLAAWRPPVYLGGCSIAALPGRHGPRLIRNYDLSPELNEGLLLRSAWTGGAVMGMAEFLWGLSDGVNADGLAVALAYGGTRSVGEGFGVALILRYVLETCRDVESALAVLARTPSHMDYNIVLADAGGRTASVELHAGGGVTARPHAVAANHQLDAPLPDAAAFTRTVERRAALMRLMRGRGGDRAADAFLQHPLFQTNYAGGFGTLFTAVYEPAIGGLRLRWPGLEMRQSLAAFVERSTTIHYGDVVEPAGIESADLGDLAAWAPRSRRAAARRWAEAAQAGQVDWVAFGALFAGR